MRRNPRIGTLLPFFCVIKGSETRGTICARTVPRTILRMPKRCESCCGPPAFRSVGVLKNPDGAVMEVCMHLLSRSHNLFSESAHVDGKAVGRGCLGSRDIGVSTLERCNCCNARGGIAACLSGP